LNYNANFLVFQVGGIILAEANEKRNWKIYADFAQIVIGRACQLYKNDSEISRKLKTVHRQNPEKIREQLNCIHY